MKITASTLTRYRNMTQPQRNLAVAALLLQETPETVLPETLEYRARLVTALREQSLWPSTRARGNL